MDKQYLSFKLIIVGQQSAGKTALAYNYVKGEFRHDYNVTVGVQFSSKTVEIDETTVQMQIWDTAGLQAYGAVVRTFYRGACGILLVYSIDSKPSFEGLRHWWRQVKEHANEQACLFLVGTKCDLDRQRQVSTKEAELFLLEIGGYLHVETSSKTGQNVQQLFERIGNLIFKKYRVSPTFRDLVNPGAEQNPGDRGHMTFKRTTTSFSLKRLPQGSKELPMKENTCC